jgi:hypothetical protein
MSGDDRGTIAKRLPPAPAPVEGWTAHPDDLIESAWGLIANAGGGDWTNESEEWREAAERWRDRYHAALDAGTVPTAGTPSATIGDVDRIARSLELTYVPEQHRLHAGPKEECNVALLEREAEDPRGGSREGESGRLALQALRERGGGADHPRGAPPRLGRIAGRTPGRRAGHARGSRSGVSPYPGGIER